MWPLNSINLRNQQQLASVLAQSPDAARLLFTLNLSHARLTQDDRQFAHAYRSAAYISCDSSIVKFAFLRGKGIGRLTGHEVIASIAEVCRNNGWTVFCLVASDEISYALAERMKFAGISAQVEVAEKNLALSEDNFAKYAEMLNRGGFQFALLGIGPPKSEIMASRLIELLKHPITITCIGDAMSVFAGINSRAPKVARSLALEWLYRLLREPRRLGPRYARDAAYLVSALLGRKVQVAN